jgi:hypothetical protein
MSASASGDTARLQSAAGLSIDVRKRCSCLCYHSAGSCSAKHFGYTLDQNLANALSVPLSLLCITSRSQRFDSGIQSNDSNVITKAITALFVLHPISCALAFLALLFGLLMARPQRAGHTTRISSFLAMLTSLIAAILTTATFALDITIGATIIVRLHNTVGHDVIVRTGNAVYMTLGAMIALWLAVVTATCGIFQSRRMRNAEKQPTTAY